LSNQNKIRLLQLTIKPSKMQVDTTQYKSVNGKEPIGKGFWNFVISTPQGVKSLTLQGEYSECITQLDLVYRAFYIRVVA
jgi:hypothetical protein